MHSVTRVLVVVFVARKPHPCLSYSRRRDRIKSVLLRSYYKGRGGKMVPNGAQTVPLCMMSYVKGRQLATILS